MNAARAIASLGALFCAAPAAADVIEISPGGEVTTYSRPSIHTVEAVTEIAAPRRALSTAWRPAAQPAGEVARLIAQASQRYALSPDLVRAVAWRESRFRHDALSPKDAVGVMQLTAGTARDLGVDRYDLTQNIHGGAAYLSQMLRRYGGSVPLALAAYNAGPGAVDRWRGVPRYKETQEYVAAILSRLSQTAVTAAPVLTVSR